MIGRVQNSHPWTGGIQLLIGERRLPSNFYQNELKGASIDFPRLPVSVTNEAVKRLIRVDSHGQDPDHCANDPGRNVVIVEQFRRLYPVSNEECGFRI
jgi:hypothetical protein